LDGSEEIGANVVASSNSKQGDGASK